MNDLGFDKTVFATKLRRKRRDRDISQVALAEKVGLSQDAIVKYESGGYVPGSDKVYALAEALGCTPNELMGWPDERKAG